MSIRYNPLNVFRKYLRPEGSGIENPTDIKVEYRLPSGRNELGFKVGDTVTTEIEYASLPCGSVVAEDNGNPVVRRNSDDWKNISSRLKSNQKMAGITRTIIRLGWES